MGFGSFPDFASTDTLKEFFSKKVSFKSNKLKKVPKKSYRNYTQLEKEMMVKLRQLGMTYKNISRDLRIPISVIRNNFEHFISFGKVPIAVKRGPKVR